MMTKNSSGSAVEVSECRYVLEFPAAVLTLAVDLMAPPSKVQRDLLRVIRRLIPYRRIPRGIFSALLLRRREGLTYREACRRAFGNTKYSERLRYWENRFEWVVYAVSKPNPGIS